MASVSVSSWLPQPPITHRPPPSTDRDQLPSWVLGPNNLDSLSLAQLGGGQSRSSHHAFIPGAWVTEGRALSGSGRWGVGASAGVLTAVALDTGVITVRLDDSLQLRDSEPAHLRSDPLAVSLDQGAVAVTGERALPPGPGTQRGGVHPVTRTASPGRSNTEPLAQDPQTGRS